MRHGSQARRPGADRAPPAGSGVHDGRQDHRARARVLRAVLHRGRVAGARGARVARSRAHGGRGRRHRGAEVPGRQRIAQPQPQAQLVPSIPTHRNASPFVAALLSLCIPGAGHLYAGRIGAAMLWFFVVSLGYVLILPGLILHMFSIASAAVAARESARLTRRSICPPPPDNAPRGRALRRWTAEYSRFGERPLY